jgi:hypothetical protein
MRISVKLPRLTDVLDAAKYLESKEGHIPELCMGLIWEAEEILKTNLQNSIRAAGYDALAGTVEYWHFNKGTSVVSQITYPVGYYKDGKVAAALILNVMESKGAGIVHRAVAQSRGDCIARMQSKMDSIMTAWSDHMKLS